MVTKIILISNDPPYYGGASNNLKKIQNILTKKSKIIFLSSNREIKENKITNYKFFIFLDFLDLLINFVKYKISKTYKKSYQNVKIVIIKSFKSYFFAKQYYPNAKIYFFINGTRISNVLANNDLGYSKYIKNDKKVFSCFENYVYQSSDKIIFNSNITKKLFFYNYGDKNNTQVINTSIIQFMNYKYKNNTKSIDLLFVTTHKNRVEKNYNFAVNIMKSFTHLNCIIIGNGFANINKNNSIKYLDYKSKSELSKILSMTKVVISPSYFDSNPNLMYESIVNNCIFLTSTNTGFNELLPDDFILKNLSKKSWISRIKYIFNFYDFLIKKLDIVNFKNIEKKSIKMIKELTSF